MPFTCAVKTACLFLAIAVMSTARFANGEKPTVAQAAAKLEKSLKTAGATLDKSELRFDYGASDPSGIQTTDKVPWTLTAVDSGKSTSLLERNAQRNSKLKLTESDEDKACQVRLLDKMAFAHKDEAPKNAATGKFEANVGTWNGVFKKEILATQSGQCKQ